MAQSVLENLPEAKFTDATVKRMYRLVEKAKTDEKFQKLVYGIVGAAMPGQWKDYRRELSVILDWFKRNVDYRRDPYGVELLQDVWASMDRRRADCDDASIWLCAAAEILGSPCRIVTVSTRPDKDPSHVYIEALVGGNWSGMDATVPASYVGWSPTQITDKKVWTRKELGLPGDELGFVEGLGMSHENGYGTNGFKPSAWPVDLTPGIPNDISKTWASPNPGDTMISRRRIDRAPIANVSDRSSSPRPGGGVYNPALPITSMPTPRELWWGAPRNSVPKVINPRKAWWGEIQNESGDPRYMDPGSETNVENYLMDINSIPGSTIAEISNEIRDGLALGQIDEDGLGQAIEDALSGFALGGPAGKRLAWGRARSVKPGLSKGWFPRKAPQLIPGRSNFFLSPGRANRSAGGPTLHPGRWGFTPRAGMKSMKGLGELGWSFDVIGDIAKGVTSSVVTGAVPDNAEAINKAISQSVDAVVAHQAGTPQAIAPRPAYTAASVAKVGIPVGMVVLIGAAALLMSGKGGKKYRSNPSRRYRGHRRGRRRSGGGKSFLEKNMVPIGIAGAGAVAFLALRKPAVQAAASASYPSSPSTPAPAPTSAGAQPSGITKFASDLTSTVMSWFGAGAPKQETQPPAEDWRSRAVFSLDQASSSSGTTANA